MRMSKEASTKFVNGRLVKGQAVKGEGRMGGWASNSHLANK